MEEVLVSLTFGPEVEDCEMFVAAVHSHGQEGKFVTREGRLFKVERFLENLNNERCKQLIGVPKLFIFQACRQVVTPLWSTFIWLLVVIIF